MKRQQLFVILTFVVGLGALLCTVLTICVQAQQGINDVTEESCTLVYDKTAFPGLVESGGIVTITLSLQSTGTCRAADSPVDVILVLDRSSSMWGTKMADAKEAAIAFIQHMDLTSDQVGVVSFQFYATLDYPLGRDAVSATQAITGLMAGSGTDIAAGLETAGDELLTSGRHLTSNVPIVILLSDGDSNYDAAQNAASRLKNEGIRIVSIGVGYSVNETLLQEIASSKDDYYHAPDSTQLVDIYHRIASTVRTAARDLVLTDTLSSYVTLMLHTFQGAVPALVDGTQIKWQIASVPTAGLTLSYQVKMTDTPNLDPGWPTNDSAIASYMDSSGQPASVTFPVPNVAVTERLIYRVFLPAVFKQYARQGDIY